MFPESALIEAGFLRQRCNEAVNLECPVCGTVANDLSLADCISGMTCGTCGQSSAAPRLKCAWCKETLSGAPASGERDCLSIQAYRSKGDPAAFAPDEPLWAFKKETAGEVEVAAESDLKRRFASGELDSSVLVRGVNQADFIRADGCPEFRDVARPRPAPEPVDPLWEYKALAGSVAQTAKESELKQWFLDGRLDAETLVRKKGRGRFFEAGCSRVFGSMALPRLDLPSATPAPLAPPPLSAARPAEPGSDSSVPISESAGGRESGEKTKVGDVALGCGSMLMLVAGLVWLVKGLVWVVKHVSTWLESLK